MGLKAGYKQTDLGVIPENWDLVPFDNIFTFYSTSNYSKAQMTDYNEVGCIHYGLIHAMKNTNYDLNNGIKYYITSKQAKQELVRNGDVIMVDASEDLEGINKSIEVFGVGNNKFISGLHTYLLRDKKSLLADNFRGVILNSQIVKNQMLQLAVGMKVFGVSKSQLINVKIPYPPLPEQNAIARVLSDVDGLLAVQKVQIAKKRAIKQGAMQELLRPKEGWGKTTLGEIAIIRDGTHQTPTYVDNGIPFYSVESVTNNNFNKTKFISEVEHKLLTRTFKIEKGDILMTRIGSIGVCKLVDWDVNASFYVSLALLKINKKYSASYITQYSKTKEFKNEAELNSLASAIPKKINLGPISKIKISLPNTLKEQTRIAGILSAMDDELAQLEAKLEKTRLLKQGLMGDLLMGKIRLT